MINQLVSFIVEIQILIINMDKQHGGNETHLYGSKRTRSSNSSTNISSNKLTEFWHKLFSIFHILSCLNFYIFLVI